MGSIFVLNVVVSKNNLRASIEVLFVMEDQ